RAGAAFRGCPVQRGGRTGIGYARDVCPGHARSRRRVLPHANAPRAGPAGGAKRPAAAHDGSGIAAPLTALPGSLRSSLKLRLHPRFALAIDGDGRTRRRGHLDPMLQPAENIGHIPVRGRGAGDVLAALHVAIDRAAGAAAALVGADRRAGHRAADRGCIPAGAAPDLVAQDAADQAADNRAADVRVTLRLGDLLALDPAALARRTDHRMHGGHWRLENALTWAAPVLVIGRGQRRGGFIVVARALIDWPHRGDAVVHVHRPQRVVAAAAQHHASAFEAVVLANFPPAVVHYDR